MTSRSDIIDGTQAADRKYGLIYTRKCGWVDLGHANPDGPDGAKMLWDKILNEKDEGGGKSGFFRITYRQMMGNKYIKMGVQKRYDIKKGISVSDKKSVALSIFLSVSHAFESMQSGWPFRWATNSGYSAEDLMSNLIGFYRTINPGMPYVQICQPVSKDLALQIWDRYGTVGSNKNYTMTPFLYPVPPAQGGPMCGILPPQLNTIKPAKPGVFFMEVK
jgi:hypothetical protein